jgi:hypothetical protein
VKQTGSLLGKTACLKCEKLKRKLLLHSPVMQQPLQQLIRLKHGPKKTEGEESSDLKEQLLLSITFPGKCPMPKSCSRRTAEKCIKYEYFFLILENFVHTGCPDERYTK